MEVVAIIIVIIVVIALAYWGDRAIAKKKGVDHLSPKERKALEKQKREEWAEKTAEKIPTWVTVLILIGLIFFVFKGLSSISFEGNKDTEAYYMCKHFIKGKLNDPGSLDFPDSDSANITSDGNTYNITGGFRANNAFGAKIQTSYTCTVTENPDRGTWSLDYLSEF